MERHRERHTTPPQKSLLRCTKRHATKTGAAHNEVRVGVFLYPQLHHHSRTLVIPTGAKRSGGICCSVPGGKPCHLQPP
jgi:hypothetical protein